MMVADDLVPIWHWVIYNHHNDVGLVVGTWLDVNNQQLITYTNVDQDLCHYITQH